MPQRSECLFFLSQIIHLWSALTDIKFAFEAVKMNVDVYARYWMGKTVDNGFNSTNVHLICGYLYFDS